jgi:hypothetical protein
MWPDGDNNLQQALQILSGFLGAYGDATLLAQATCATADVNGAFYNGTFHANGLPDCTFELALVQAVYNDPGFQAGDLTHALVAQAFSANYRLIYSFLDRTPTSSSPYAALMLLMPNLKSQIAVLVAGYATLGDPETMGGLSELMLWISNLGASPPAIGDWNTLSCGKYFGPNGDADGDGCSNREEYEAYKSQSAPVAVANALNPAIHPDSCAAPLVACRVSGSAETPLPCPDDALWGQGPPVPAGYIPFALDRAEYGYPDPVAHFAGLPAAIGRMDWWGGFISDTGQLSDPVDPAIVTLEIYEEKDGAQGMLLYSLNLVGDIQDTLEYWDAARR